MSVNATPAKFHALGSFGQALGLAFQIIDDILDVTQSTEVLGKTAGKDANVDKATYPSIVGLEKSRKEAAALTKKAMDALTVFGTKAKRLHQIADFLLVRNY
jgi:geranylgeranyl diphosphate synthase type II